MEECFIQSIKVNHSRNVENLEIPLSNEKRQHLILTGKNGSGKTSLLLEIVKVLKQFQNNLITSENSRNIDLKFSSNRSLIFNKYLKGDFLLAFFNSKRHTSLAIPSGIKTVALKKNYTLEEKINSSFIQYIVNLRADRSFARDDNEYEIVLDIDLWFKNFEKQLKKIFDAKHLQLIFDRKKYNFLIKIGDKEPFNFNSLSDGYSAIISIVTELILRMEEHNTKSYDLEGVVLIDEIETHLHVDLQKKILPFLIDFFPKIQFIVTTHSPFVLSSLSNATICDLETKTITTDLSSYSYDALIESYFESDKYSDIIKEKISQFENLMNKKDKSNNDLEEIRNLKNYFDHAPKYLSDELYVKLQQIELNNLKNK